MDIIERIKTYAKHGGAWGYLEGELVNAGMSSNFAQEYTSLFRKTLGQKNADEAVQVYELWLQTNDEEQALELMLLYKL